MDAQPGKQLRILHTTEQIDYAWGGLTYVVPRFCLELEALGHRSYLGCLSDLPEPTPFPFIRRFHFSPINSRRKLGLSNAMERWIERQASMAAIDVMHVHGMWRMPNVYPCRIGPRHGIPVIFAPHGSLGPAAFQSGSAVKKLFWPLVQRPAMHAATCFHATAPSEAQELRSFGFRQPIAIIPNGVEVAEELPRVSKHPKTALCLGRIHPKKAIDVLLRAWREVQQQHCDWRLRIVGPDDGGHLPALLALARDLKLERVEFGGPLEGRDKLEAFAQASLFVMPTWNENFGLTVAESLVARTPVLVSKGAPWPGIEPAGCGWWIDCGVESFTRGLRTALACSDDQLADMGVRGRDWVATQFGWKAIAGQLTDLYTWTRRGCPPGDRPSFVQIESPGRGHAALA